MPRSSSEETTSSSIFEIAVFKNPSAISKLFSASCLDFSAAANFFSASNLKFSACFLAFVTSSKSETDLFKDAIVSFKIVLVSSNWFSKLAIVVNDCNNSSSDVSKDALVFFNSSSDVSKDALVSSKSFLEASKDSLVSFNSSSSSRILSVFVF